MTSSLGDKNATVQLGVGSTGADVTTWFRQQLLAALADPLFNLPQIFKTYMADYVATSGLNIPIGQVIGFSQFVAQAATPVVGTETTSSLTYTNLATVGPELTELPDGQYVIIFGCTGFNSAGTTNQYMSVKYGAAEATDNDGILFQTTQALGLDNGSRAVAVTLSGGGNNTITSRFRTDAGTASFLRRWLLAIKFANA